MRISRPEAALNYAVLVIFSVVAALPLLGVLINSVTPSSESAGGMQLPSRLALGNFGDAWAQGRFSSYLLSSVIVTASVVVINLVVSVLAGWAFARMRFWFSNALFVIILVGLMLPSEAFIIPLYYDLRTLGLTDTYASMILPQSAQSLAFGTFWMRNQFRQFPTSVIEAGELDGARDLTVLWRIAVPGSRPAILTMCLLVSMWTWNEFLIPLVMVTKESLRTAPLGLAFFSGQHATDYALLSAGGIIVALPIVLLYVFGQRYFISGMVGGAAR